MDTDRPQNPKAMDEADVLRTLQSILAELSKLNSTDQQRVLASVNAFLGIGPALGQPHKQVHPERSTSIRADVPSFSSNFDMTPKDFLFEKQPKTDVERIACLAYYLTHYRASPFFKTVDLSMLNTEAAQPKFSNTAYATNNATTARFLVPAAKGQKQLSAYGEQFVAALPDRDAAKAVMSYSKPRKKNKPRTRKIIK